MSQKIAKERIRILFDEANNRPEKAERYFKLAEKIGMKSQISIPSDLKKQYCSNCYASWKLSENCRVRVNSKKGYVNYTCRDCGSVERYGYK